jgi:hypothetical protein
MHIKALLIIFFLLPALAGVGQGVWKGQVIDRDKGTPVPKANVFLNNTSIGTSTNDQGEFELAVPKGKIDLVVSSIGYETFNQTIDPASIAGLLVIKLKLRVEQMDTVVIEPFEKNGWENWGAFFISNFLGTPDLARNCRIVNTEVLRFRHSKENSELTVIALEPLIIENKELGYTLRYQLETFSFSFKTRYLLITGYPFFTPMDGSNAKKQKWDQKRREVYSGSLLHFMRSVYANKIVEEGFIVRPLKRIRILKNEG